MSNWFEDHPARSIIIHSFIVAGAVWAAFAFVFDDNKVAAIRAQAENEKAAADQHKAKTEFLEVEIARLREENRKYLEWMANTPNTIPYLEQKLKHLVEENGLQKSELTRATRTESSGVTAPSVLPYSNTKVLNVGESLVDPKTDATLGIGRITQDFTASAVLNLPGEKPQELAQVKAGASWTFDKDDKRYQLTVSKVDWFLNKAEVILKEIGGKEAKPNPSLQGTPKGWRP
jgi:hypothetical protein